MLLQARNWLKSFPLYRSHKSSAAISRRRTAGASCGRLPASHIERLETRTLLSVIAEPNFDIVIRFDGDLTADQQAAFTAAEQRWEQIIVGDVRDFYVRGYGMVDDLLIDASAIPIDGPKGVIGHARTEIIRPGSWLPASGVMEFDTADLASLESSGYLEVAIFHEMGHVIGLGQRIWATWVS